MVDYYTNKATAEIRLTNSAGANWEGCSPDIVFTDSLDDPGSTVYFKYFTVSYNVHNSVHLTNHYDYDPARPEAVFRVVDLVDGFSLGICSYQIEDYVGDANSDNNTTYFSLSGSHTDNSVNTYHEKPQTLTADFRCYAPQVGGKLDITNSHTDYLLSTVTFKLVGRVP